MSFSFGKSLIRSEASWDVRTRRTYVWDQYGGGYRWITSPAVVDKYGFSWGKIKTVSCICDTGPNWT